MYRSHCSHGYIIEVHKLTSGEGLLFRPIYEELKSQLSSETCASAPCEMAVAAAASPLPCADSAVSNEEISVAIDTIVRMSGDKSMESKEEATLMLYDISMHDALQQHLCSSEVMSFFVDVLQLDDYNLFENLKHNVILTLANLSESMVGQTAILEAGALPFLFKLAGNGSFATVEMRRESARILANMASKLVGRVNAFLCAEELESWMDGVDEIEDDRLRMHADRAKEALTITA